MMRSTGRPSARGKRGRRAAATGPAEPAAGAARDRPRRDARPDLLLPILVACAVAFATSFNTLWNGFVYDDTTQVLKNPWLHDLRHLSHVFSRSVWSFQSEEIVSNYYRPLMHVVYMLAARIFGLRPWGFHLVNLVLHTAVTALVFVVGVRLLGGSDRRSPRWLSGPLLAALLFATHPVHTEAVAWIASVPELSFTALALASFLLHTGRKRDFDGAYWAAVALFFLSSLCKETALVLPLLLFVHDAALREGSRLSPRTLVRYLPHAAVAAGYLALRLQALGGLAPEERHAQLSAYECAINALPLFAGYLGKLLLPVGLNAFHVFRPVSSLLDGRSLLSGVAAVAFGAGSFLAWRWNKRAFVAVSFVAVPLLPVLYVPALGENSFAERYLYLPSVGFVLLAAMLLDRLAAWGRTLPAAVAAVMVCAYAAGTMQRNAVWRDDLVLYEDTLRKSPGAALILYNYGTALMSRGRLADAARTFEAALAQRADFLPARVNLSVVLTRLGNTDGARGESLEKAVHILEQAVAQAPGAPDPHRNLGTAYGHMGRLADSAEQFEIVLRLQPNSARAHNDLGMARANLGQLDEAIALYDRALTIDPEYADAHYNRGLALERKGFPADAKAEYERALAIDPEFAEAHFSLSALLAGWGSSDDSLAHLESAVRLLPDKAEWHNLLGIEYGRKGDGAAAEREFEAAVRLDPEEAAYRQNLERAQRLADPTAAPTTRSGTAGGA